jgi:hypothetical protein
MAGMTTWPARRVGDRILCGRPVPDGGCRGEIATVEIPTDGAPWFAIPIGFKEEPPGSHIWLPKRRTRKRAGRPMTFASGGRSYVHIPQASPPFWRACPVCNVLAEVTADLLES